MSTTTPNLHQRIVAIMDDMGAVGKGGKTTYGEQYAYHRIDDIEHELRQALVKHRVVALVTNIETKELEHFQGQDKYGKPRTTWSAECNLEIWLINADNPEEVQIIAGWGQGLDYSDKATGKAISYAAKAAYLSAFHLRGQPDNEADDIPRDQQPQQRPQPRGRRQPPKPQLSPEDQTYVTDTLKVIAVADATDLDNIANDIKGRSVGVQNSLRVAFMARQKFLKENPDAQSQPAVEG